MFEVEKFLSPQIVVLGLKFPKSSIVSEFGGEERHTYTSALFRFSFKLEMVLASWDIYSCSDGPSKLLTLLICAHFALSRKGVGFFRLLYIREKLNLVRSLLHHQPLN